VTLRAALDRTLLLMRDHVAETASDADLLRALTGTQIVLAGDGASLSGHAAQSAFITAALLMARSGHMVYLDAPDMELVLPQPPLEKARLVTGLLDLGDDLLPGVSFSTGTPLGEADLAVIVGDARWQGAARHVIRPGASDWAGWFGVRAADSGWTATTWPIGALAAAAFAAGEAFKSAMRRLSAHALRAKVFEDTFAASAEGRLELAPTATPKATDLLNFDCISGGAITHAALYSLARVPGVRGCARVIEPQTSDISNMNRYALLRRSRCGGGKAEDLATFDLAIDIEPVPCRYEPSAAAALGPLAPVVLIGADDIPTRWEVQRAWPEWLGVGSTTHYTLVASFHRRGVGCAGCLHPVNEPVDGNIPTVAFVSFWAGLLLAAYHLRHVGGEDAMAEQHLCFTPVRPASASFGPVTPIAACPIGCAGERPER
jgi:hypothetical protein